MAEMLRWLITEHFGWFMICCAVAALWLGTLAMIIEYFCGWVSARITVYRDRQKYRTLND